MAKTTNNSTSSITRYENVHYSDGTVVKIKRVARAKLADFIELLDEVISAFAANNGAIGSIILDDKIWQTMGTICSMIPVMSTVEGEVLDFDRFSDNYEEICRVFCTSSVDLDTGELGDWKAPILSKLHMLDYSQPVGKGLVLAKERQEQLLENLGTTMPKTLPDS